MNKFSFSRTLIYLKAARVPFLTATFVPVLLGSVIAWYKTGLFNWYFFWLVLLGIAALHTGTNLINDYFDHKNGNDEANLNFTPFSGGSRVIQDGQMSSRAVFLFGFFSFLIAALIGIYINLQLKTNVVLILGLTGVMLGVFYTASPLKIGYRGMGEIVVGLCFGPLVVLGSYYVQTKTLDMAPVVSAVPVGILVLLVLYINEFPDYHADSSVGKNTAVVLLGKAKAVYLYQILLVLTYFSIFLAVISKVIPLYCLFSFITMPLAYKAAKNVSKNFNNTEGLLFSNAATIKLHLIIGIILSLGFILGRAV